LGLIDGLNRIMGRTPPADTGWLQFVDHTPDMLVSSPGQVVAGINANPIRQSVLSVLHAVPIKPAGRIMRGHGPGWSENDPREAMVWDTIDPIWFPQLVQMVAPSGQPEINVTVTGAQV